MESNYSETRIKKQFRSANNLFHVVVKHIFFVTDIDSLSLRNLNHAEPKV